MRKLLAICLLAASLGAAQQPQLRFEPPQPSTVRLGETCQGVLRVYNAVGQIQPQLPLVRGAIVQLGGSRQVRNLINGRLEAYVEYGVLVTPQSLGTVTIPSFPVKVGDRVFETPAFTVEAVADLRGKDRAFLEISPSSTRVYVNEPLRFAIECGVDTGLSVAVRGQTRNRDDVYDVEVRAPWLADLEGAAPLEAAPPKEPLLILCDGAVQAAEFGEVVREGRKFHRFRFEKAFLPSSPGVLELPAATLAFKIITSRGRTGFFGERLDQTQELFVYGEPLRIEVLPLPKEGRPADYSGGVGRFTMSARLDRDTVKVGNSVKVLLTIEGIGNTERLTVPELAVPDGLHSLGKTEKRDRDHVEVTYDLTPLNASVREVPGVTWSYFDTTPGKERYETLRTPPLPLTVQPLAENETLSALPGEATGAVTPGIDDIYDIEPLGDGPPVPLPTRPGRGAATLLLLVPWLLGGGAAAGLAWRRRRAGDVVGRRARLAARAFKRALASGEAPHAALVAYLADRLGVAEAAIIGPDLAARLRDAGAPDELVGPVCAAVEAGVAARYGGSGEVDAASARALVEQLEGCSLRRLAGITVAVLVLALGVRAQQGVAAKAEAAYRAGDYAAAADAFAAAVAEHPDARLLYNLGNSRYRSGDLAAALVAWERARLASPRDPQINANLALVRGKLDLGRGEGEPFLDAVRNLRDRFTARELLWICLGLHVLAALGLTVGRRLRALRLLGVVALVPALLLTLEVLWWEPARPPKGIVVADRAAVVAEPREGLEALLKLRQGVTVEVLGEGPQWTQVRVRGRSGYLPSAAVGVVRP